MTRQRAIELLVSELQAAEGLPPNAAQHLADLRNDVNVGPGFEAAIRAVIRASEGAK